MVKHNEKRNDGIASRVIGVTLFTIVVLGIK